MHTRGCTLAPPRPASCKHGTCLYQASLFSSSRCCMSPLPTFQLDARGMHRFGSTSNSGCDVSGKTPRSGQSSTCNPNAHQNGCQPACPRACGRALSSLYSTRSLGVLFVKTALQPIPRLIAVLQQMDPSGRLNFAEDWIKSHVAEGNKLGKPVVLGEFGLKRCCEERAELYQKVCAQL